MAVKQIQRAPRACFGPELGEHLAITARHAYPEALPAVDRGSLDVRVELAMGGFHADYLAWFEVDDLIAFRDGLRRLYDQLSGEAAFTTIEDQLRLRFRGDGRGHITVEGVALDQVSRGNRLEFRFMLDQTELPAAIQELDEILCRDRWWWSGVCAGREDVTR